MMKDLQLSSTASTEEEIARFQKGAEMLAYGPYPAGNRHERRKAAKLMRTDRKKAKRR